MMPATLNAPELLTPAPVRVQRLVMPGDYVLASKYSDGDPQDHWCVGFYKEAYLHCGTDQRHIVVDNAGNPFRANGFRRVKKISKERGAWMLQHAKEIETSGMSVWHFARCSMQGHNKQISHQ
jgi:hypothetical protein